jgi:hypothetical protein
MAPKFIIIPNTGAGDCYYLSVIDSLNNKNLSEKFLHFMGKKYTQKTKKNVITVKMLREFISDHSDQLLYYLVSLLLNIPDDHKATQHFPQEDVDEKMNNFKDNIKNDLVSYYGKKIALYINKYVLSDKTTDNETKRIKFVKYYKKYIKKQYNWVCFVEVNIFELLYTKFIKSVFNEEGFAIFINANDKFIRHTPVSNFETDYNLYLNYKKQHYEAWVFNNNSNVTLKNIRLNNTPFRKGTQKLKRKIMNFFNLNNKF